RPFGAQLVAGRAAAGLHALNEVGLILDIRIDAVAAGRVAGKLTLFGHAKEREPVARRVVLSGRSRIGRRDRFQVHYLAGSRGCLRRVHESVAADPDVEVRLRQIGYQVPPAIVGDDNLDELRRQVLRLGDHPDAGFRTVRTGDDAADVVV